MNSLQLPSSIDFLAFTPGHLPFDCIFPKHSSMLLSHVFMMSKVDVVHSCQSVHRFFVSIKKMFLLVQKSFLRKVVYVCTNVVFVVKIWIMVQFFSNGMINTNHSSVSASFSVWNAISFPSVFFMSIFFPSIRISLISDSDTDSFAVDSSAIPSTLPSFVSFLTSFVPKHLFLSQENMSSFLLENLFPLRSNSERKWRNSIREWFTKMPRKRHRESENCRRHDASQYDDWYR